MLNAMQEVGKRRRLKRIFSHPSGRIIVVPLDDSLLAGPTNGLENLQLKTGKIVSASPNAIIGFQGLFRNQANTIGNIPTILNLTASTTKAFHTRKSLVSSVEQAIKLGSEAVAVHVNLTSKFEHEMLRFLGEISLECQRYGMPLLAIMYPRKENLDGTDDNYLNLKKGDKIKYAELVAHAARVGVELGADIIKTQYTGTPETFQSVVNACSPIPIIVAGGPQIKIEELLLMAYEIVKSGGAGVSFGRNIFSRDNPVPYIMALKEIIQNNKSHLEALEMYKNTLFN